MIATVQNIMLLIPRAKRTEAILLIFLLILMAFVDVLGLVSLSWFVAKANGTPDSDMMLFFINILSKLGLEMSNNEIVWLGGMTLILLTLHLLVASTLNFWGALFAAKLSGDMSTKIYGDYLYLPWELHAHANKSKMTKDIVVESERIAAGVIEPCFHLFSNVTFAIVACVVLTISEPVIASAAALAFALMFGTLFLTVKQKLYQYGSKITVENSVRQSMIAESLANIKTLILSSKLVKYVRLMRDSNDRIANARGRSRALKRQPKIVLEYIILVTMIIVVGFVYFSSTDFSESIPRIILVGLIGIKLLSVFNNIFSNVATTMTNMAALKEVDLKNVFQTVEQREKMNVHVINEMPVTFSTSISFEQVSFNYFTARGFGFEKIDLYIEKGEMIGIYGGSGAGKTTITELMMGLIEPTDGRILIDSKQLGPSIMKAWQKKISFVPQDFHLLDGDFIENIALDQDFEDVDQTQLMAVVKAADLANVIDGMPKKLRTRVGDGGRLLSGGQRQRVAIARALFAKKELLIFDEPTSALDPASATAIKGTFSNLKGGLTIVIISHDKSVLENCDKVWNVMDGIVEDVTRNFLNKFEEL